MQISLTTWTATKINSNFKVMIQKVTSGGAGGNEDKVIVDWVGTYVQYPELNVTAVSVANSPQKGDDVQFNITVENIGNGNATDVETRIKITGNSYDWSGYICNYLDWDTTLYADTIESHTITIPKFFNHDGKYYAWNAGDYNISQVDVQCDEGATDSYTNDESFTIDTSNSHIVFVAAIAFDNLSPSAINDTFNNLEIEDMFIANNVTEEWDTTTFSNHFSTDFQLQLFESDSDTSGITIQTWGYFNAGGIASDSKITMNDYNINYTKVYL